MTRPEYEPWHTLREPALRRLRAAADTTEEYAAVAVPDLVRCLETLAGFEANYRRELLLGGRIGHRTYCHTESEQPSCYTLQLRRGQPPKYLDQVYAEETEEYFPSLTLIETDVGVRFWFDAMGEDELRFSRSAVEDIHKALGKYLRETEPPR